ncbi:transketolase [Verrucomicrobia bacterium LW23]|nr:transketolase [Verrucomicrobia bacterium LW23]
MSHRAGTPHLGSSLSVVDILVALYGAALRIDPKAPEDPLRDRAILSKGHAAMALYAVLAEHGFFGRELIDTFATHGAALAEQPSPHCAPGVELATGSLGHGLPISLGLALAAKIRGQAYRVFTVLSDGECNEGTVWEGALLAPALKLDNLVVIVDYNKWQATGRSEEVTSLSPLVEKWRAFGWHAQEVDGHDLAALTGALATVPHPSGKPLAIIAHTVKGKGVSFMEDDNNWHYRIPKASEVTAAFLELGLPAPVIPAGSGPKKAH